MKVKRVIPLSEVAETDYYWDMAILARMFRHRIVEDDNGTWRWEENRIVDALTDGSAAFYSGSHYDGRNPIIRGSLCLNTLWMDFHSGKYTCEEMVKFYMGIGYSLCGFCDVWGQRSSGEVNLPGGTNELTEDGQYHKETVIAYFVKKWQNEGEDDYFAEKQESPQGSLHAGPFGIFKLFVKMLCLLWTMNRR